MLMRPVWPVTEGPPSACAQGIAMNVAKNKRAPKGALCTRLNYPRCVAA
jgi:hypothetical protein